MSAPGNQSALATEITQLPALLHQAMADLADSAITYLLGGHYYDRTAHTRHRHFPAVFALRQGEVWNVEVGPDFVAFDTEFTIYPERGEPHYPGPWADRFRATIPFAQLYQLCRKMLTPDEQTVDTVSYGPETIIYYNATVYRNYPTPADINQAYPAASLTVKHPLAAVLMAVAAGLADPGNQYVINTTYFNSPYGPIVLGMLHLNAHTVWDLQIEKEAFTCSVLLNPHDRQEKSLVRVGFDQVWQVVQSDTAQIELEEAVAAGGLLYNAPQVLQTYARQGRPA